MNKLQWYSGKYDRAFKEVMLKESNRDLLIMLIEHILNIKIEELEILNVEKNLGNTHVKGQRLDLSLKTNKGKINVEVNSNDNVYTHKKNFSYLADTYSHSTLVGEDYNDTLYIQINLSYGLSTNIKPISIYKVMDEDKNTYVDNFIIYNLNMEYYMKLWYNKNIKQVKKDFILVMLGLERNSLLELAKDYKVVSRYMNELDKVNEEPEFREYMSYEKEQQLMTNSLVRDARLEGHEEGFEQGREQGHEEGFEQGIERGFEKAQREMINNLIATGMSQKDIEKIVNIKNIDFEESEYQRLMTYEKEQQLLRNSLVRDARLEGFEKAQREMINNLLAKGMTEEEIAKLLDIKVEDIK